MFFKKNKEFKIRKLFPEDVTHETTICDIQDEINIEIYENILGINTNEFKKIFQIKGFQEKCSINGKSYSLSESILTLIKTVFKGESTNTFMELDHVKNNLDACLRYNIAEALELQKKNQNLLKEEKQKLPSYYFENLLENLASMPAMAEDIKVYLMGVLVYLKWYANFYESRALIQDCSEENIQTNILMQEKELNIKLHQYKLPEQLLQCITAAEQMNDALYEYRHSSFQKMNSRILFAEKENRLSRRTYKNAIYSMKEEFESHYFHPQTINCPNGSVIQFQSVERENMVYLDVVFTYLDTRILLTVNPITYELCLFEGVQNGILFADWCATYPGGSAFAKRVESIVYGAILQTITVNIEKPSSILKKIIYDFRVAVSNITALLA